MNALDRAIGVMAPRYALDRAVARARLGVMQNVVASARPSVDGVPETKWRGASRFLRSMSRWLPGLGSAYTDTPPLERARLAARSADAYRNHAIAGAAIARMRTNIVGTGLFPHAVVDARALGITEDQADQINAQLDSEFASWADNPLECDIEASLDFYGLQALALMSSLIFGDAFALTPMRPHPANRWELKLQLIDGARVSNPNGLHDTTTLNQGVELDQVGFPIAVHISRGHPGEALAGSDPLRWDRYEVYGRQTGRRRVLQVWADKDRIGQVRGTPVLAPILEPLQQLETWSRSELMAAVVSSLFTVFLERSDNSLGDDLNPLAALQGEEDIPEAERDSAAQKRIELSAGGIVELPEGLKATFANPARPNQQFDPFFLSIATQIAARLEIPRDVLLLQYNTSYSAARAAMLEGYRMFHMRRWWLVQQLCQPVRALWLDEAVARSLIDLPGYADPVRRAAYSACMWVGPAKGAIDEEKEARAAKQRIDANLSNETIEAAAMTGQQWMQIHNTRVRERRIAVRDTVRGVNTNNTGVASA